MVRLPGWERLALSLGPFGIAVEHQGAVAMDRHPEGIMLQSTTHDVLGEQLLRIAREPDLRGQVYEQLGEYCHQCRNRLNSLKLSIYLAMKQEPPGSSGLWNEVDRDYRFLERRIERVQVLCRPMTLSRVSIGLDLLIDDRRAAWSVLMAEEGRELEFVAPAERAVASFDVERLGQALDDLVAWRVTTGPAAVNAKLRWWVEVGYAHISWEETRGDSLAFSGPRPDGDASWALPFLTRVVLAHGGELSLTEESGWRLELSWPTPSTSP